MGLSLLIISKSFPPNNSAQALQSGKVAEAIADAGVDVRVIAGIKDSDERPHMSGIKYIPYQEIAHSGKTGALISKARNLLSHRHWIRNCVREVKRSIEEFRPNIIMSVSSPIESHQVVLDLGKKRDVKWVAYFSDPCPACISPTPYRYCRNALIDAYDRGKARLILSQANAIILPSPYMVGIFESELGVQIAGKTVAIPHIGTISNLKPMAIEHEYSGWLIHVGGIARQRCSSALLEGINFLKNERDYRFPGLLCIGDVCPEFREMVHAAGLEDCIHFAGHMNPHAAEEYARNAG